MEAMEYSIKTILPACILLGLGFANQSNASVINNIGGINYEWLEFSNTVNLSRNSIDTMLTDTNSSLYGYRYATRVETQALLESYMPYVPDSLNTFWAYLAPSAQAFFDDFGITHYDYSVGTSQLTTEDGFLIDFNMYLSSYFNYGAAGECGDGFSCKGRMLTAAQDGVIQAQFPPAPRGFDATFPTPSLIAVDYSDQITASLLVRETLTVPLPAAFWLFGSGMLTLFGATFSRRNKASI
jgi:hypothetical protein